MNNHMMLIDNKTVLLDIHRNVLAGQGDTKNQHPVSATLHLAFNKNR
jgi:hypothetical protein